MLNVRTDAKAHVLGLLLSPRAKCTGLRILHGRHAKVPVYDTDRSCDLFLKQVAQLHEAALGKDARIHSRRSFEVDTRSC